MLPLAEECGVDLLVEPEPHLLIERPKSTRNSSRSFQHPRLGLNFDIGHFYCVGVDPAEAARRLAPHIRHVHLGRHRAVAEHKHLVPGRGAIDYRSVLRALDDVGYRGWSPVDSIRTRPRRKESPRRPSGLAEFF